VFGTDKSVPFQNRSEIEFFRNLFSRAERAKKETGFSPGG